MTDESANRTAPAMPPTVDRDAFEADLNGLRVREKAHTREGDAIAAARRRLPMVEVDAKTTVIGPDGPVTLLDAFEGRQQLIAYYFMWSEGHPAAEQCEGCTWVTTQVTELSYLHSRGITFAVMCQGPYDQSVRYRDFMGWDIPWYSALPSLDTLLVGRQIGLFHLVCYLRDGERVFETYWTTGRGAEAMDYSYALMDLSVYGRQESWEDSPAGWPQHCTITRTDAGPARLGTGVSVAGRTPHRPMVALSSRALRRPWNRHGRSLGRPPRPVAEQAERTDTCVLLDHRRTRVPTGSDGRELARTSASAEFRPGTRKRSTVLESVWPQFSDTRTRGAERAMRDWVGAVDLPGGMTERALVLADAASVAAVMAAQELLDAGEVMIDEADIVADWQRPSFDLAASTVGVFEGDRLVAYAEVSASGRGDAAVHPDYRGRGIGTALARWMQDRARSTGVVIIGMPTPAGSPGARLMTDLGYRVRWTGWVLRLPANQTISPQPVPDGYTVRRAEPNDYRAVHAVMEEAFSEWSDRERESYEDFAATVYERPGFEPWHVRIARAPLSAVVGAIWVIMDGEQCFVGKLAVQREHRHRGLARALLADAFGRGREHGAAVCELSTDSRTGALALYEKLGMVVTSTWLNYAIEP